MSRSVKDAFRTRDRAAVKVCSSEFNEVLARVAQVAADDRPSRAGALNRALFDGDPGCGQLDEYISDVVIDDEADVRASRCCTLWE